MIAVCYVSAVRALVDEAKLHRLMAEVGRRARGPGRVYLTGGATALLYGWRGSTVDVDIKLDPEPAGVFEAIASIKNELDVNVELASPDLFLPPLPEWRERSVPIVTHGSVEFFHYDLRAQALAKIARGHERDVRDVRAMLDRRLVSVGQLQAAYAAIESELIRYPNLDPAVLRARLDTLTEEP